jgi:hypothetical protein
MPLRYSVVLSRYCSGVIITPRAGGFDPSQIILVHSMLVGKNILIGNKRQESRYLRKFREKPRALRIIRSRARLVQDKHIYQAR